MNFATSLLVHVALGMLQLSAFFFQLLLISHISPFGFSALCKEKETEASSLHCLSGFLSFFSFCFLNSQFHFYLRDHQSIKTQKLYPSKLTKIHFISGDSSLFCGFRIEFIASSLSLFLFSSLLFSILHQTNTNPNPSLSLSHLFYIYNSSSS